MQKTFKIEIYREFQVKFTEFYNKKISLFLKSGWVITLRGLNFPALCCILIFGKIYDEPRIPTSLADIISFFFCFSGFAFREKSWGQFPWACGKDTFVCVYPFSEKWGLPEFYCNALFTLTFRQEIGVKVRDFFGFFPQGDEVRAEKTNISEILISFSH